jgi:drug/metabolite transporter (DMT)-like permease
MTRIQANLLLLLAAAIWGGGFVAQSTAMQSIGPFWFIGLRFAVADHCRFALHAARSAARRHQDDAAPHQALPADRPCLFGGAATQQLGLQTTTVTNSSFITGPLRRLRPDDRRRLPAPVSALDRLARRLMAVTGIFLLSGGELSALSQGDLLTVVCAVFWAGQITLAGMPSRRRPRAGALDRTICCHRRLRASP